MGLVRAVRALEDEGEVLASSSWKGDEGSRLCSASHSAWLEGELELGLREKKVEESELTLDRQQEQENHREQLGPDGGVSCRMGMRLGRRCTATGRCRPGGRAAAEDSVLATPKAALIAGGRAGVS
jgi:hypothetical protein